jgi:GTP-binding protein
VGITTRLLISAASAADFPQTGLPEIAMAGRSNVGKSSLINALVKQKVARTSAAPGKTRLANFYLIEPGGPRPKPLYLVDLPGYGYARGGADSVEEFEALTQQYFDASQSRRHLAGVLQLIDARHPDLPQDTAAFEWLLRTQLPIAIVATKVDKLNRSDRARTLNTLEKRHGALVLPESALEHTGLDAIWHVIRGWAEPGLR